MANWTREELVIVCAELVANGWQARRANDLEAKRLSALLNAAPFVPAWLRGQDFRSPNSVQRKMYDLLTARDSHTGKRTKGGRATAAVVKEFDDRPREMAALAQRLTAQIEVGGSPSASAVDVDWESDPDTAGPDMPEADDAGVPEGAQLLARHYRRERNRTIRSRKIAAVQAAGLPVACDVCRFDFADTYGELGDGYIEVHHVLPLHASGPTLTQLADLVLLCSNCHRMIHRARPWITPQRLRQLIS